MKVAGFTFIRNAVQNDYSIVEAINSILPICDEFIIAHGNSTDATLDLLKSIKSDKIKMIQTTWDDTVREGGRTFALETDKAFAAISPDVDWCFYIQGDECVHEKYLDTIKNEMQLCLSNPKIEGLLFKYKHFYGSYDYFAHSRRWYRKEIRVVRNLPKIHSYKDAQGFRIGDEKINVKEIDAYIYHYGWVKPPKGLTKKMANFATFYDKDVPILEQETVNYEEFDYGNADKLVQFQETHPKVMVPRIEATNWKFSVDPTRNTKDQTFRRKILDYIETNFGIRLFEYKNYKKIL
jgi:hypothetical protein